MRPDWENVVPAMVDDLFTHPEVDPGRVVLVGRSFGGVLAPRGASGEPCLAALVVEPGQFDIGAMTSRLGDLMNKVNDPAADAGFDSLLTIPVLKTLFAPRLATHGVKSVRAYCAELLRYTNEPTVAAIACPCFVSDNETDPASSDRDGSCSITSSARRPSGSSPRGKGRRATAKA